MKCKECGTKLPTGSTICYRCGKRCAGNKLFQKKVTEEQTDKPKRKVGGIALAIASGVVVLGVIVMAVLWLTGVFAPRENNVYNKNNYTVWNLFLGDKMDDIVATVGDEVLTNAQLNVFYWMHIYNYAQYYEADFTKPLHQQVMNKETGMNWQQYLVECAINSWKQYQAVTLLAEAAKFELPQEYKNKISNLVTQSKVSAKENGYGSADEMLAADFGKGVTTEEYRRFFYLYYTASLYYEELKKEMDVTDEDMDTYYEHNKQSLYTYWEVPVTKDMGKVVDVRHILYIPSGGKVENGVQVFSDAAWENCRKDIQAIYDEWLAGDADEESFAQLAYVNSDDSNSTEGGLYVDISKDVMVDEFEEWCMDENRKYGDHGLVKTKYGYHLIFFVGSEDGWERYCRVGALEMKGTDLLQELISSDDIVVNYSAIVLADIDLNSK